jgi:hypothetical protein
MPNSVVKQANIFAKESLKILENELLMPKLVYQDYTSEFDKNINGFKVGDTISIKRPSDFTVRTGASQSIQDVVEGSTTIQVATQIGVDVSFTSKELTTDIDNSGVTERVLKPAMIQLANNIDQALMNLYRDVPNWAGTPGQVINSFSDFAAGPTRMDELAVLQDNRSGVLSPADYWGMLGSQTALYMQTAASGAYRDGSLGNIGGVSTGMSQNVPTHTVGVATGTPLIQGASQSVTYDTVKDTYTQTLNTDGWTNSTTGILKAGDVFTIANVFAVNPVTKAVLPFLRQFVVKADANSGATTGPAALTISPPIIISGAQQTCSAVPADNAAITVLGSGSTGYRQNMIFHKNAFAFVSVPMEMPPAVYGGSRQSYKGINIRLIPTYNSSTDVAGWRYDVLFGTKAIDPRLAVRLSGAA